MTHLLRFLFAALSKRSVLFPIAFLAAWLAATALTDEPLDDDGLKNGAQIIQGKARWKTGGKTSGFSRLIVESAGQRYEFTEGISPRADGHQVTVTYNKERPWRALYIQDESRIICDSNKCPSKTSHFGYWFTVFFAIFATAIMAFSTSPKESIK